MESFVIIVTERYGHKGYPVCEVVGEERAINEAMRIFRDGAMQKVLVVNENLNIVFKDTRRCKCTNVQQELSPSGGLLLDKCMDCGIILNHQGHYRIVEETPAVEEENQHLEVLA